MIMPVPAYLVCISDTRGSAAERSAATYVVFIQHDNKDIIMRIRVR
jgi:hypothetical protein